MDGGAWWAAVHGVANSRAQLNNLTFTFHFHTLEKEMATHSSILAWRIPGTEEPSGLRPWGHKRVRHGLMTKQQQSFRREKLHIVICAEVSEVGISLLYFFLDKNLIFGKR